MRNRFKPNLTPRGSQRTTRANAAEASASAKAGHGEAPPKSATSDSSTVSPPRGKEEEPQTTGSTNSDASPGGNINEPDTSSAVQGTPAPTSTPGGQTRRSRIKPSVASVTRQRQSGSKTRNILKSAEPRRQPVAETIDQQSSQSSDNHTAEVTTAGSSLPETEQHSQPVLTHESNTEKSRETPAQPTNSSTPAREQNSEQQPSRRKRPLTNLPEPAPQRRRSSSVQRETSDDAAQQEENVLGKEKETAAEASNSNDKEEAQAGKKRANLDRDQQNPDAESRTDAASQGNEAETVEDGDANPKKPPKAKRRRGSRSFKPKEPADISKMTMQDLIYYNPKTNPMKSSLDAKKKNHESRRNSRNRTDADMREEDEERSVLEAAQPEEGPNPANTAGERQGEDSGTMSVAPQVKLAADGSIILDEESLIIHTQEDHSLDNSEVVYEDTNQVNFAAYKKHKKVERWSLEETLIFYKALSQVGTDFSLMGPIFPKRTRRELKSKFKREEKLHREQIEKALSHRAPIDVELFAPQVEGEELDGDVAPSQTKN